MAVLSAFAVSETRLSSRTIPPVPGIGINLSAFHAATGSEYLRLPFEHLADMNTGLARPPATRAAA